METNYTKCNEFSWHLIIPLGIETIRDTQYLSNCWAIAIASCIGDNFCIQENIQAIYPSSLWISSLLNDFLSFTGKPQTTLLVGLREPITNKFIEYLTSRYFMVLESCLCKTTINAIVYNDFINKNGISNLNKYSFESWYRKIILTKSLLFNECCDSCLYKDPKSDLIVCDRTEYGKYCNKKNDFEYKFKIFLDNYSFYTELYSALLLNEVIIENTQIMMKQMLCSGTILAYIFNSKDYKIYKQDIIKNKYTKIPIFFQKNTEEIDKPDHIIEILGWGLESGVKFWYIKDSNCPNYFLKLPFAIMDNLKMSIGPDFTIKSKHTLEAEATYLVVFFTIKPKALDFETKKNLLIENKIQLLPPRYYSEFKLFEEYFKK